MARRSLALALVVPAVLMGTLAARGGGAADLHVVEGPDGKRLHARGPTERVNPASVIKVATTLWALERLGPDHRFTTRFVVRGGAIDRKSGVLTGDLLVRGGADPDFHLENAFLVARALNEMGLREVQGRLQIDDSFWIGWEGGSEKRLRDARARTLQMGTRLRDALDESLRGDNQREAIASLLERRGLPKITRASIVLDGEIRVLDDSAAAGRERVLLEHQSNPLVDLLRRFNSYSNNDIERLGASLGSPDDLARWLRAHWGVGADDVQLASLSGLGSNRVRLGLLARLVRDLEQACAKHGLELADVLPANGCGPGTLQNFPRLAAASLSGSLTAKTGTLRETDGGVAVIAGVAHTNGGARYFASAVPRAGADLDGARSRQESWLLQLIRQGGGAQSRPCGTLLPYSDTGARLGRP